MRRYRKFQATCEIAPDRPEATLENVTVPLEAVRIKGTNKS